MKEDTKASQLAQSLKDLQERTPYGEYLKEILEFYVPLALRLPSLRNDPDFMKEEIKAVGRLGINDVATNADKYLQDQIKQNIKKIHPDWGFWGEEGDDEITELDPTKPFTLVNDPIEGTINFKNYRDDDWGSVIALVDNKTGESVIGIVAHPAQNKFYVGVKNSGAYILKYGEKGELKSFEPMSKEPEKNAFTYNNSPQFTKELSDRADRFIQMGKILETNELKRSKLVIGENGDIFEDPESGALEVIKYKGTIYFRTTAEMAAVFVIIQELGGKITDADGNPWNININSLISAFNEKDYEYLKKLYDSTNTES